MKILQVVHTFPPYSFGGAEKYTFQLSKELSNRHEVHVLFPKGGDNSLRIDERRNGSLYLHEINLNESGFDLRKITKYGRISQSYVDPALDKLWKGFIEDLNPDIIHFQHLLNLSVGFINIVKELGIASVLTLHDFWFMCPTVQLIQYSNEMCERPTPGICRKCWTSRQSELIAKEIGEQPLFDEIVLGMAKPYLNFINTDQAFEKRTCVMLESLLQIDRLIAPSNFLRSMYISHGLPEEIILTSYGYDYDVFDCKLSKPKIGLGSKLITFGYLGRIVPIKGVHILLEAFRNIQDNSSRLLIFGGYDENSEYFKELQELKGDRSDVQFMGMTTDIKKVFNTIDVLIFPSIWYENCPLVLSESNIARVPIIASNLGAIPEFVHDGRNGLLFEPGNAGDLFAKMSEFIRNPDLVTKLYGDATLSPPSITQQATEIEKIYRELAYRGLS